MSEILNPFRIIFYMLNVLVIASFLFLLFSTKGLKQNDKLEVQVLEAHTIYESTLKQYNDLKYRIKQFKHDEFYQRKVIHEDIGYIQKNERIYIFTKNQ